MVQINIETKFVTSVLNNLLHAYIWAWTKRNLNFDYYFSRRQQSYLKKKIPVNHELIVIEIVFYGLSLNQQIPIV